MPLDQRVFGKIEKNYWMSLKIFKIHICSPDSPGNDRIIEKILLKIHFAVWIVLRKTADDCWKYFFTNTCFLPLGPWEK